MNNPFLHMGAQGEKVERLKKVLKTLEYSVSDDHSTFDMKTRNAVEAFQNDYGLSIDGIVNEKTWLALEKAFAGKTGMHIQAAFESSSTNDEEDVQEEANEITKEEIKEKAIELVSNVEVEKIGEVRASFKAKKNNDIRIINKSEEGLIEKENIKTQKTHKTENTSEKWEEIKTCNEENDVKAHHKKSCQPFVKRGSDGEFVIELQKGLKVLGYIHGDFTDGTFCKKTDSALRAFQREHSIKDNGVAGANTWGQMYQSLHKRTGQHLKPILKYGSRGDYVFELQTKLAILKLYDGNIDGIFGEKTERGVREFQEMTGLYVDGVVGEDTWHVLDQMFSALTPIKINAKDIKTKNIDDEKIYNPKDHQKNSENESVEENEEEGDYNKGCGCGEGVQQDNKLNNENQNKGMSFYMEGEIIHKEDKPVILDNPLMNNMPYEDNYQNSKPHGFLYENGEKPVLREGMSGEYVYYLQQILYELDYLIGEGDGKFEQKTAAAVRSFQRDHGVFPDGVIGEDTWNYLDAVAGPKVSATAEGRPVLKEGSRGDDVVYLQRILIDLGYLTGVADGVFGPRTKDAVKAFQKAYGLTNDGIVGRLTWNKLEEVSAQKPPSNELPPPEKRPVLREGDSGDYVYALQQMLISIGYLVDAADGKFGPKTAAAVRAFQRDNRLTVDGIVGISTWRALDAATATPKPPSRPTLSVGSKGEYVVQLQERLKQLGFFNGTVDGVFGPLTESAVRSFQASKGLVANGIVDSITWDALDKANVPTPPEQPPVTNKPTLKEGSKGEYVVELQTKLKALGFYSASVDGFFGAGTTAAVKRYQNAIGLPADGIVGPATWAKLDQFSERPPSENPVIKFGSTGDYVVILQSKLKILGYFYPSITGSFGTETENAVKAFQRDNNLLSDGIVGKATWVKLYELTEPQPPEEPPEGPRPTLRLGDSGPYVTRVQNELTTLLYYTGPISGYFDAATQTSVKMFQDANRLTPDGVIGRFTWYALDSLYPPPIKC